MRWMCVFSCMLLFQISAVAYSQKKVTLDVNGMEMVDVIQELRKQTGYKFFFNHNELKKTGRASGKFLEKDLSVVLDEILGKTNLTSGKRYHYYCSPRKICRRKEGKSGDYR